MRKIALRPARPHRLGGFPLVPLLVAAGLATISSSAAVPQSLNANVGTYARRDASIAAQLDEAAAELDADERKTKEAFEDARRESADVAARLVARGRAYVRMTRAGLLPLGGGFERFLTRTTRLERWHHALERDVARQQALHKTIVALGKRIESFGKQRGPLELRRASAHESESALNDAQERASAFERAFASPSRDGHTAIYGANMPFGGPGTLSDFASLKGHLAFPVAGRAEIVRAKRRGGGQGLEMRVPAGSSVQAVFGGRVAVADKSADFGRTVIVDHGGSFFTVSAGLDSVRVRLGEDITAGTTLGTVGDTGLYFEIRRSGDTIDPAPWFGI
jgi:murein DD-endopeptidase MepM/ murein hydrolase activator NlpD